MRYPSDYCILLSHGNSTDLGLMIDAYLDLAFNCKINVFSYDYSGYGLTSHTELSDFCIMEDIKHAYNFLRYELKFEWSKIIVYGQSLGSGPSTFISSLQDSPVGGLVLHSGYSSGLRIMIPKLKKTHYRDFFPNVELIKFVRAPVFILHGTRDREIPVRHAELMIEQLQQHSNNSLIEPWYVEGAGHNNIELDKQWRKEYFLRLRDFFQVVKLNSESKTPADLLRKNKSEPWDSSFNHIYARGMQLPTTGRPQSNSIQHQK